MTVAGNGGGAFWREQTRTRVLEFRLVELGVDPLVLLQILRSLERLRAHLREGERSRAKCKLGGGVIRLGGRPEAATFPSPQRWDREMRTYVACVRFQWCVD